MTTDNNSDPDSLSKQESESLIARLEASDLSSRDKQVVIKIVRGYFYLSDLVQESGVRLKSVREFFFGKKSKRHKKSSPPKKESEESDPAESEGTSTDRPLTKKPEKSTRTRTNVSGKPKRGHGRLGVDAYTGAQTCHAKHEHLKAGEICPECGMGTLYRERAKEQVQLHGQAPVTAIRWQVEVLRCSSCKAIFNARDPQGKHDVSVKTTIALSRYFLGLAFYRLEHFQQLVGVPLPDATQWDLVEQLFDDVYPVFVALIKQAAQSSLIYHDDTGGRILTLMQENQSLPQGARYGIHSSGFVTVGEQTIILFFTGRAHAGENLDKLLDLREAGLAKPIQMSDASANNAPKRHINGTIPCFCNAHGIRKFKDIRSTFPDPCEVILQTLSQVYENDRETHAQEMDAQKRQLYHEKHSGPLLDQLKSWMEKQQTEKEVEPNSALGQAMNYMLNRWEGFTRFLKVAGVPLDNNITERVLKRLILQRKNSFFYQNEYSAYVASALTSLIMTAAAANVNVFDYLNSLQRNRFEVSRQPQNWLPWNYSQSIKAAQAA